MMDFQSEQDFLAHYDSRQFERFSIAEDMLIFGISNKNTGNYRKLNTKKLSLLLIRRDDYPFKGKWNLPGGFVNINENLEAAAQRILQRETNLNQIYIEQLYTFGEVNRDPRMRIISIAYMSLINREALTGSLSSSSKWFDIFYKTENNIITVTLQNEENILSLSAVFENNSIKIINADEFAFDHAMIILTGLMRLKNKVNYTDIVFNLMPEHFTLTELQMVYESILQEKLLPAAFRRIIATKVLPTDKFLSGGGHRPSRLFKYKKE